MNWSPEAQGMVAGDSMLGFHFYSRCTTAFFFSAEQEREALSPAVTCRINELNAEPGKWLHYPCN